MADYKRFAELGTATVSDALDRLGLPGSAHGIAPIADGLRMAGPAYTVRYVPAGDPKGTVGDYIDNILRRRRGAGQPGPHRRDRVG